MALRDCEEIRMSVDPAEPAALASDPNKMRVAATYNAAAEHFDDDPLGFWDRFGRATVAKP
jgi:hypothetical protein